MVDLLRFFAGSIFIAIAVVFAFLFLAVYLMETVHNRRLKK